MASTSAPRGGGAATGRIHTAASTLASDNQSLVADMRKLWGLMKEIGVDLEKDNQSDMVKDLDVAVVELVETYEDCMQFSSVVQSVANGYQPGTELTDFKKLFDDEYAKLKANSSSVSRNHQLVRQYREAIWNVHHAGQPMPGEEEEDIVMTSTQFNILNIKCPISGKAVTELVDPVRSIECKHIYDKKAIVGYIRSRKDGVATCPITGCPKLLRVTTVICDPLLKIEIEEMRSMNNREPNATEIVEDFTDEDI